LKSNQTDSTSSIEYRIISTNDLESFKEIQSEYLDKWTADFLKEQFSKSPNLYVGSFLEKKLVGIAYGSINKENSAVLNGIAVKYALSRNGIGSRLLGFFEEQVRKTGSRRIGLGSGEGFAEQFYLKMDTNPWKLKPSQKMDKFLQTKVF